LEKQTVTQDFVNVDCDSCCYQNCSSSMTIWYVTKN